VPEFNKRGFLYIRKSDEYGTNHPNYEIMKMNGFTVPVIRPKEVDPLAIDTFKSARKAGLFPALWEVPKKNADGSREGALQFATRLNTIIADLDKQEAYAYAVVCDNEDLSIEWHEEFAPAFAAMRSRLKILSIDPLKGDMWGERNIYTPYVANGYSIDVQCYNDKMEYFDAARCWSVVCATPGVRPWKVRITLPPGRLPEILQSQITKLGPIGIGLFAPNTSQITTELPIYGEWISGARLPTVMAYR
jgi:hypothetical protein